jgi:hypothetical protein
LDGIRSLAAGTSLSRSKGEEGAQRQVRDRKKISAAKPLPMKCQLQFPFSAPSVEKQF